ncbi:Phosphoinositide phosphatase SAC6 [Vitis vinifera]|uniref:Phosphoinositide phosphatase SAC6 n=1 Tax=Vitis vinifera TaxID=29760 RepID=A0A438DBR5_VITVI|nr:Phosphoinositide phosphatase SAC6 [Vitis vinifera]
MLPLSSAQRLHDLGDESKLLPLWRQADPRFLWNNYMLEVLIDNKLDPYLLPVIQGNILISYFQAAIGKDIIDVTLIARRCTRRTEGNDVREIDGGEEKKKSYGNAVSTLRLAGSMTDIVTLKHVLEETPMTRLYFLEGTRMWRRGADSDGYVANFVESEQIVQLNGYTASFVQNNTSDFVILKAMLHLYMLYAAGYLVCKLVLMLTPGYHSKKIQHGSEGRLSEKFASAMQHIVNDDVRYLHFDFHRICGHVHFERLSILYDQIVDFLTKNR